MKYNSQRAITGLYCHKMMMLGGTLCQHRMALMCPLCLCSPSLSKQNVCATATEILISIKIDNKRLSVLINLEHETMNASWSHSSYLIECLLLSIFSNQNVYSQFTIYYRTAKKTKVHILDFQNYLLA